MCSDEGLGPYKKNHHALINPHPTPSFHLYKIRVVALIILEPFFAGAWILGVGFCTQAACRGTGARTRRIRADNSPEQHGSGFRVWGLGLSSLGV